LEREQGREQPGRCGWIFAAALAAAVSLIPLLIPRTERLTASVSPEPVEGARPPLAPRVLFILVDGLGANAALHPGWMPILQARLKRSASGIALASFPTVTPSGLRALLGGRTGMPQPAFLGGMRPDWSSDSVLLRARAAGRRVFVVGQQDWGVLFKGHTQHMDIVPYVGLPGDKEVLRRAFLVLNGRRGPWEMLAIHLFDLDPLGHHDGVGGPKYRRKLLWLDKRIAELAAAAGKDACVVVTADHGQTEKGDHGGVERDARRVPYVLWGAGIRPGGLGTFPQRDSAPTLAALMGLPPPVMSSGMPRLDALRISGQDRAAVMLDLLEQRRRRWLAARADWPWLSADPRTDMAEARRLWLAGDYAKAAAVAESSVRSIDGVLESNSPSRWVVQLNWVLWLLVLAASFGAAWPRAHRWIMAAAAILATACAAWLAGPLLHRPLWPLTVACATASSAGLLLLSLASGLSNPALSWTAWSLWWVELGALAFPEFIDVSLWSWATLSVLLAMRMFRAEKADSRPMVLASGTLLFCFVLSNWTPGAEMSYLRYLLPSISMRRFGAPPWRAIEMAALLAMIFALCRALLDSSGRRAALVSCAFAAAPMAAALLPPHSDSPLRTLAVSLLSLAAAWLTPLPGKVKALWLSLIGLALCRTQCSGQEACLLAWAALTGWQWASLRPLDAPLWEGLGLASFGLWAYAMPGGHLDFSHISVAGAYGLMGESWHPHLLAAAVALAHACYFVTPILPLLAEASAVSLLGAAATLGALSAGSLSVLWVQRFYFSTPRLSITDTPAYERMLWAAILTWLLLATWAGLRLFLRLKPAQGPLSSGAIRCP